MKRCLLTVLVLVAAPPALADLDLIDCDAEKAARNAAMKATVGVHGKCDPKELAERKKEDAGEKLEDQKGKLHDREEDRDFKLKKDKD